MVLLSDIKHSPMQKPLALMNNALAHFYHVPKLIFYLEEFGARKDQTCHHLVKKVLISFHEPTLQKQNS